MWNISFYTKPEVYMKGFQMLGVNLNFSEYMDRLKSEIDKVSAQETESMSSLIYEAWENGKCVYFFGNGGSGTTATHMSEDLGKSSLKEEDLYDESKKRLKVMSLTDNLGWILAVGK